MKHLLIISITAFICLFSTLSVGQNIVINEIMSDNNNTIQDIDGDYSDWIELYNNSNTTINITNYKLSDDINQLDKWTLPNVNIQAHDFLLIFASGKDIHNTDELHTNFKIKSSGETLYLSDTNNTIISQIDSIAIPSDNSCGLFPDGSEHLFSFESPSPNASNNNSNSIYYSHQEGFYDHDFNLTIIPPNNSEVHYTLNGDIPTQNSPLYSSPIHISKDCYASNNISAIPTTPLTGPYQLYDYIWQEPLSVYKAVVLRFGYFKHNTLQSKIYTKTYFIDPDIKKRYTFPIISLVTDSLNLFDYDSGIYIPGRTLEEMGWSWIPEGNYINRGRDWERDVHISYFENNGTRGFETDAGMRMRGYGSTAFPLKSFGLYFRNEYGLNKIEYPIFNNSNTDTYKRLIVRSSGNDFLYAHFRDALLQNILDSADLDLQNFQPSVVFFNGEYWGIHNIREKYDKYYFKYHFDIEEDNINILSVCGFPEEGDDTDFLDLLHFANSNNMSINENYYAVKEKLDINNFIDYEIAEIYFANYDWPCNNYKIWKTNDPGSKWRFLIHDLDLSFGFSSSSSFTTKSLEHATNTENEWPYCECSNILFNRLLMNEEFKQEFLNRFVYHLKNTFNTNVILKKIDEYEDLFMPEMEENIQRWNYPKDIETWQDEIDILREFAEKRPCYMKENIIAFFGLTDFDFNCVTHVDTTYDENTLVVAPNPNNGSFKILNTSEQQYTGDITISNTSGKIVWQKKNSVFKGNEEKYLNLTALSSKIYFFTFTCPDFTEIKRIIIIK